jgi:site-specific recombinase XerD
MRNTAHVAGVRRRFAPPKLHQAVQMSREGIPLLVIQRQLGHADLGVTSVHVRSAARSSMACTSEAHQ